MTMTCEPRRPCTSQPTHISTLCIGGDLNNEVMEGRTSGGGSSVAVLLRAVFRAHIVWVSDFRYDVLICFGLSL